MLIQRYIYQDRALLHRAKERQEVWKLWSFVVLWSCSPLTAVTSLLVAAITFSVTTAPCKIKPKLGMYCRLLILEQQQPSFQALWDIQRGKNKRYFALPSWTRPSRPQEKCLAACKESSRSGTWLFFFYRRSTETGIPLEFLPAISLWLLCVASKK